MDRNDGYEEERERREERKAAEEREQSSRFFWFTGWLAGADDSQEFVLA